MKMISFYLLIPHTTLSHFLSQLSQHKRKRNMKWKCAHSAGHPILCGERGAQIFLSPMLSSWVMHKSLSPKFKPLSYGFVSRIRIQTWSLCWSTPIHQVLEWNLPRFRIGSFTSRTRLVYEPKTLSVEIFDHIAILQSKFTKSHIYYLSDKENI